MNHFLLINCYNNVFKFRLINTYQALRNGCGLMTHVKSLTPHLKSSTPHLRK